jgi:hypothetical protein
MRGFFLLCFEICFPVKKQSKVKVGYGWFISLPVQKIINGSGIRTETNPVMPQM